MVILILSIALHMVLLTHGSILGSAGRSDFEWTQNDVDFVEGYDDRGRIIGGTRAEPGELAYQVEFVLRNTHWCGGSIVGPTIVLSAGHCFAGRKAENYVVISGSVYPNRGGTKHKCDKILIHEDYNGKTFKNDVALGVVSPPFTFSNSVKMVQMADRMPAAGTACVVSGFGYTTSPGNTPAKMLMKTDTTVQDPIKVAEELKMFVAGKAFDGKKQIGCKAPAGKSACQGDSGGPLVEKSTIKDGTAIQVGIVSWGVVPCTSGRSTVYTAVASQRDWIKKKMTELTKN